MRPNPRKKETPSAQPPHAWRRLHDGRIIAEVNAHPGMGVWRASAYRVTARASEVAYIERAYSLLTEAHRGADELVRREFGHECRVGVCGRWLRWPSARHRT